MLEKRRSPRFAMEAVVLWKPESRYGMEGPMNISHTRDLSTGGLSAMLQEGVRPGDTLQLELKLPGGQSVYSRVRVTWVSNHERLKSWEISVCEGGVEFLNLSDSDIFAIDQFISEIYGI